jgi:hypothetical protein
MGGSERRARKREQRRLGVGAGGGVGGCCCRDRDLVGRGTNAFDVNAARGRVRGAMTAHTSAQQQRARQKQQQRWR